MKIIGTGLTGLVGLRVIELLKSDWEFTNLSLETGCDITDFPKTDLTISKHPASWVFHFAAYTDVDAAEKDRINGQSGLVWKINVAATRNIVSICRKTNKKLLYVSTDFVFDGRKSDYSEEDLPNPINWYGLTKYEAEKEVQKLGSEAIIARISYPFGWPSAVRPDFVAAIVSRFKNKETVYAPKDLVFVPTFIDDIAQAIKFLVGRNLSGIYHITGSQALSAYEAAKTIARAYGYDQSLIRPTTVADFYKNRALRPLQSKLVNDKITKYGIRMIGFREAIKIIASGGKNKI